MYKKILSMEFFVLQYDYLLRCCQGIASTKILEGNETGYFNICRFT